MLLSVNIQLLFSNIILSSKFDAEASNPVFPKS